MPCFKFHQNDAIKEKLDFWGTRFFQGAPRGTEGSDFKNSKNPHTERWSQPKLKISALQLDYKVLRNRGKLFNFWGLKAPYMGQEHLISKIRKYYIQNGGPNPHRKFQQYSTLGLYKNWVVYKMYSRGDTSSVHN